MEATCAGAVSYTHLALPIVVTSLVMSYQQKRWDFLLIALIATVGFGLIGFVDDYIKIAKKRSLGLTPMQKIVPQFVLSLGLAVWALSLIHI